MISFLQNSFLKKAKAQAPAPNDPAITTTPSVMDEHPPSAEFLEYYAEVDPTPHVKSYGEKVRSTLTKIKDRIAAPFKKAAADDEAAAGAEKTPSSAADDEDIAVEDYEAADEEGAGMEEVFEKVESKISEIFSPPEPELKPGRKDVARMIEAAAMRGPP
jgi:hypothetical protein